MKTRILLIMTMAALMALPVMSRDYVITDFGAVADTSQLSTDALQQAIDRCSHEGGGRVVIPTGHFKTGSIVLRSNVNLHLDLGATLYGSTDLKDYTPMKSDYVSLRTQTTTIQLIYADKVSNVVIDGYGTIDGRGRTFKKLSWNDEGITRPHLLRFIQSTDVVVRDITLRNSGCWMQHYLACDRLRINGIKVVSAVLPIKPDVAKDLAFKVRAAEPEHLLCVIGSVFDNRPMLNVTISEDLVKVNGINAGQLVREAAKLMQGGGGGQPHFASAGGKNADGITAAVDKVIELAGL